MTEPGNPVQLQEEAADHEKQGSALLAPFLAAEVGFRLQVAPRLKPVLQASVMSLSCIIPTCLGIYFGCGFNLRREKRVGITRQS